MTQALGVGDLSKPMVVLVGHMRFVGVRFGAGEASYHDMSAENLTPPAGCGVWLFRGGTTLRNVRAAGWRRI